MNQDTINFKLPIIDISKIKNKFHLSEMEESIINGVIYNPINGVGVLRATRPKHSNLASWVWRKLMMFVSPEEKFHYVATAFDDYLKDAGSDIESDLSQIVEKVISTIPQDQLNGIENWRRALGN